MEIEELEKKITHLSQLEITQGAVSTILTILVEKGISTIDELQDTFLRLVRQPNT